ncbi:MAG: kelch repeat-containing protein, partial [Rubrivivax sp.]|nr:kelch repeat-containing protein [Rubrivivax sp.]
FGGVGFTSSSELGDLNDLWRFNPGIGQWTWVSGSSTASAVGVYGTQGVAAPGNVPGARRNAAQWVDLSGQLWLLGGSGFDSANRGYLNDLWRFHPATGLWTWVAGSSSISGLGVYGTRGVASPGNTPGARDMATSWIDASGDLWLFGGTGLSSTTSARSLNDLWRFRPSSGLWTWMGGSSTADAAGAYGTRGVASVNNMPGGRYGATSWIDPSGHVWLFGGYGNDAAGAFGLLNDLWRFNPATGQWAWVSGSSTRAVPGVYGTVGTPTADTGPGARSLPTSWIDGSGNLWLFGGYGYGASASFGDLDDVWRFSASSGQWTWVAGSTNPGAPAVYGSKGTPSPDNTPGGRGRAAAWFDRSANVWLFGGASANGEVLHNDLWRRGP